jgi:hypothetical protein
MEPGPVGDFGVFRHEQTSAQEASPIREFARFLRRRESEQEIVLLAGQVIVLGPAVDLLRCRALPGERELRAFSPTDDGVLRLAPGVWFCTGQDGNREGLDERDYREIFEMSFHPEIGDRKTLPFGLSHDVVEETQSGRGPKNKG